MPDRPVLPGSWIDPRLFEGACGKSKSVLAAIEAGDMEALLALLDGIFEDKFLVAILQEWDQRREQIAEWIMYAGTHAGAHYPPLKFPKPHPKKLYFWMCRDCGEARGIHFYPIDYCRNCGGRRIVRKTTRNPMGYAGSKLLARMKADSGRRAQ